MTITEDLENRVLLAAPEDQPNMAEVLTEATQAAPEIGASEAAPAFDQISLEVWFDQWKFAHDGLGGIVQMRTGHPCPLGDQARSEGGQAAAEACYKLLETTPALAKMFLGTKSGFWGNMMVVGLHGFNCIQVVKESAAPRAMFEHRAAQ